MKLKPCVFVQHAPYATRTLGKKLDERLCGCDYVTVGADGGMTVVFRDGTGMKV